MKKTTFIYFRESALQSAISDTITFGYILGGFFVNALLFGGKWYIYLFFMFMALVSSSSRASKKAKVFTDKKELQDFVKGL